MSDSLKSNSNDLGFATIGTLTISLLVTLSTSNGISSSYIKTIQPELRSKSGIEYQSFDERKWEESLKGIQNTGSRNVISRNDEIANNIIRFSRNFISSQREVPEEFEKVFKDSFWDLLA